MALKEGKTMHLIGFIICIAVISVRADGWEPQSSGTNNMLKDVFFINPDTGWIAGFNCILETKNGGVYWQKIDSSDYEFWAIEFTDAQHGFAVGYRNDPFHGFIYQTNDGGRNWKIGDSTDYELNDIHFVDKDTGYAVGGGRNHATILKTTNAGENWEEVYNGSGKQLFSVDFSAMRIGWAVGDDGRIYHTEDGFTSMESKTFDIGISDFRKVQFIHPDTGWVIGGGYIYRTTDGGANWQLLPGLSDHSYTTCIFTDFNSGWLCSTEPFPGNINILYSSDGGENWQIQDSSLSSTPNSIFFIDKNIGWVVGLGGMVIATTAGGVTWISEDSFQKQKLEKNFKLFQNYPNPFNPVTTIEYTLPQSDFVELKVYNMLGKIISTLVSKKLNKGNHTHTFDGTNLASGIYYYQIVAGNYREVKKMILLK